MSHLRSIVAVFAVVSAIAVPLFASAQTVSVSALQQELQTLLTEIAQLQQSATSTATVATPATAPAPSNIICPKLVRTLALGDSGTDVADLQGFLAQNPLIYPEGSVTGYFNMLTQDAVQRWQTAYGIVSSGTPASTGYGVVGPRTRAAMTASCMSSVSGQGGAFVSPSAGQQPLCPVAPEPATACPGTWSPLTNATGCTIAWQCAIPLPGAASSTPASSAASSSASSAASSSASSACATYALPLCDGGTNEWLGVGSNGCNLGYQCVIPGQ